MENNNLTSDLYDATLSPADIILEELGMNIQSRFHEPYSIYLYCTIEWTTAQQMLSTNILPSMSLVLYETPEISQAMAKNISNARTLKIALNLWLDKNEYCYDQLTMNDKEVKERFKLNDINTYKSKCVYTRELVTEPSTKMKVIQYKVKQSNKLSHPQYV